MTTVTLLISKQSEINYWKIIIIISNTSIGHYTTCGIKNLVLWRYPDPLEIREAKFPLFTYGSGSCSLIRHDIDIVNGGLNIKYIKMNINILHLTTKMYLILNVY